MYYMVKNKPDAEKAAALLQKRSGGSIVTERIKEVVGILDSAYGVNRMLSDYGGIVLAFPTRKDFDAGVKKVFSIFHLDGSMMEYREHTGGWAEELYMLSSDNALVFMYPCAAEQSGSPEELRCTYVC